MKTLAFERWYRFNKPQARADYLKNVVKLLERHAKKPIRNIDYQEIAQSNDLSNSYMCLSRCYNDSYLVYRQLTNNSFIENNCLLPKSGEDVVLILEKQKGGK